MLIAYPACCLRDSEHKSVFNVPLPRTNYYKNSFSYSGAVLWNSLPLELRKAESLNQFKRLASQMKDANVYSPRELYLLISDELFCG